jgi:hypothetical protein
LKHKNERYLIVFEVKYYMIRFVLFCLKVKKDKSETAEGQLLMAMLAIYFSNKEKMGCSPRDKDRKLGTL